MGPLPPSICVLWSDAGLGFPRARPGEHLTRVSQQLPRLLLGVRCFVSRSFAELSHCGACLGNLGSGQPLGAAAVRCSLFFRGTGHERQADRSVSSASVFQHS